MIYCPRCSHGNPDGSKFCEQCGCCLNPNAYVPNFNPQANAAPYNNIDFEKGYRIYGNHADGFATWAHLKYGIPTEQAEKLYVDFLSSKGIERAPNLFKKSSAAEEKKVVPYSVDFLKGKKTNNSNRKSRVCSRKIKPYSNV